MKLPALLLLFAALASGTARAQADAGKSPGPPFSITIKANPSVIQAGQKQQLFIAIVLTNLSDHPMDAPSAWMMGSFDMVCGFDIRDSTGKQIPWAPPATAVGITSVQSSTLEPGKSKSEEVNIKDFYDLSKPGSYTVQAKRLVSLKNPPNGMAPIEDVTKGVILSNVITITVVPAKQEGQPFSITISGPQTVNVGDTVVILPMVKNVSNREFNFGLGMQYIVLIHDERGKEPRRKPGLWTGSSSFGYITPGRDYPDLPTDLSSEYDLIPGKYVVQFARHLDDNDFNSPIVKSNEITITVVPAQMDGKPAEKLSDLSLELAISEPSFAMGANVVIHIILTNTSGRDMLVGSINGSPERNFQFDVRRQDGNPIVYTPWGKAIQKPQIIVSSIVRTLHDKDIHVEDLILNRIVDLKPGIYTVQAWSARSFLNQL